MNLYSIESFMGGEGTYIVVAPTAGDAVTWLYTDAPGVGDWLEMNHIYDIEQFTAMFGRELPRVNLIGINQQVEPGIYTYGDYPLLENQ